MDSFYRGVLVGFLIGFFGVLTELLLIMHFGA